MQHTSKTQSCGIFTDDTNYPLCNTSKTLALSHGIYIYWLTSVCFTSRTFTPSCDIYSYWHQHTMSQDTHWQIPVFDERALTLGWVSVSNILPALRLIVTAHENVSLHRQEYTLKGETKQKCKLAGLKTVENMHRFPFADCVDISAINIVREHLKVQPCCFVLYKWRAETCLVMT